MTRPEDLGVIQETLDNPDNFRSIARTASGLLLTRCVDRRLTDIGGSARMPGNALGAATVLMMAGEVRRLTDGVQQLASKGIRPGAHRNICAFDHNLELILKLVADGDTRVTELYGRLGELVNAQLPGGSRAAMREPRVRGHAERALEWHEVNGGHHPDEMIEYVAHVPEGSVVTPGEPLVPAKAFVISTDPGVQVLDGNVVGDGSFYLDSHAKVVTQSDMGSECMPDALALSAATAVLVARAQDLPILVTSGAPGSRLFETFSAQE